MWLPWGSGGRGVSSRPESSNGFWPLGEPADIDSTCWVLLRKTLQVYAPTNGQVRRLRLISSQGPVLPSRHEFLATTVVDSVTESDIRRVKWVHHLPAEQSPREEFFDMHISMRPSEQVSLPSTKLIWRAFS